MERVRQYKFRLEQVLKYRETCEEKAAINQARALEEYNSCYELFRDARDRLDQARQTQSFNDAFDLLNSLAYCETMESEVKKREAVMQKSNKKLKKCRQKLVEAMQDRSVMEKLKEKDLQNYHETVGTRLQKETDEMATRQYNLTRQL